MHSVLTAWTIFIVDNFFCVFVVKQSQKGNGRKMEQNSIFCQWPHIGSQYFFPSAPRETWHVTVNWYFERRLQRTKAGETTLARNVWITTLTNLIQHLDRFFPGLLQKNEKRCANFDTGIVAARLFAYSCRLHLPVTWERVLLLLDQAQGGY